MASQVVLITGCSQGIGKEAALTLARDPQRRFKVYATMRNLETRQADLKTEAGSFLNDTLFIRELDVTKQDTIDKIVKEIIDNDGKIDVLVNNAAVICANWWETAPMETYYDIMEANYFGSVRMTKAVVPYMKEKRCGRILQVASILGFHAIPVVTQYVASKFALEGFSESIAPPLRKFNVWVSVIEPGCVKTNMVEQFGDEPTSIWINAAREIPGEEDRKIVTDLVSFDPEVVTGPVIQETQEVAKLIQDVMLSPKPDYRYQTSQSIKKMAKKRFIDPSGNMIINDWLKG
ncbi:retinol dehydrogenase 8-like [Amphiura filiformis]|uniref:retinol dehydrogenase 8-like n=1 Tax=Amphiura filiformis TaxID=82378 RepID=UPI003B215A68